MLPALVASQSLVLIGGGLSDGNAEVWDRMVELAVSSSTSYCAKLFTFQIEIRAAKEWRESDCSLPPRAIQ